MHDQYSHKIKDMGKIARVLTLTLNEAHPYVRPVLSYFEYY